MRKGQGLPLSTIVLAGLAILVLVIVATIFGKGISIFGAKTVQMGSEARLKDFQRECMDYCNNLKNQIISLLEAGLEDQLQDTIQNSLYCKSSLRIGSRIYNCTDIAPCIITYSSTLYSVTGKIDCECQDENCGLNINYYEVTK